MRKYSLIELISDYDSMARIYRKCGDEEGMLYCKELELKKYLTSASLELIGKPLNIEEVKRIMAEHTNRFYCSNIEFFYNKHIVIDDILEDSVRNYNIILRWEKSIIP